MNVIFTCGGTGGHINPAIAVAKLLRERSPNSSILFVGADNGMETKLVPREGFELRTLTISNFQRKLTPQGIAHNFRTIRTIRRALQRADEIIDQFKPDVILGTGGYASFPMLRQGARRHIPTAVHESNAVPGLTTKMVAKGAERILVNFEESREQYENPERVVVTGMPVRPEFLYTTREAAREALGLDNRPLVVSCWGSLGAREMNKKITDFFVREIADGEPWNHIHATGSFGWRWMPQYVKEAGVDLSEHPSIDLREYIYDMPLLMAAADLVICRGGAATISEVAASATPCIIVPSPNATNNHQEKNARLLEGRGAAEVLLERDCYGGRLYETAQKLLKDQERRSAMRSALRQVAVVDAAEQIYSVLLELAKSQ
ncbi:MAG TPA: UDP-N-acetylglucosamine--N-acetylmuramyl-(pentapeptide) pyrophosphoryl-undecaprenol N-acetylglucosamine transferase [Candidatus Avoscillospira avistercoris]|uniref:UDP-N-acetylglucosamine--N-acetylmuramyl-(pentapeptide) pyrophosphoryl-undecaprenol N-acetylglucosamine transferase n=1 Tax=Candidatus Avoscillospira avistercoris TaxID=2840707 RepID=A0A9D1FB40_9FIRM|nr:UDP-N-acetylglucosamine--N-acetylmuramyl-(pentapeptide) pyrophosphoryl-undecaprenol N-acetylglucosamine transferase [Candidatus Avoscillospira avistercoris]